MPEIKREFTNFTPGELTYHESIPNADTTAQEMKNLRVDTHGALRQRQAIRALLTPNEHNITGIAASADRLYFINSNGQLFYRNRERDTQTDTEIPIRGRPRIRTATIPDGYIEETKLAGRISIIHEYENFVIITSEGQDQGYWIDLRDAEDIAAYPLGFNPPTFTPTLTSEGNIRFYRFTYIRDLRAVQTEMKTTSAYPAAAEITGDELTDDPFAQVESNPTQAYSTEHGQTQNFTIEGLTFPNADGLETGIVIYRSREINPTELTNGTVTIEDEDLDFRRVGVYPPPRVSNPGAVQPEREDPVTFNDTMSEADRAEQQALRFDNDRMPQAKSITAFNDRIFVPNTTELRYSDIRFGNLTLWAYPKTNAIRRPVDCVFAQTYRDMLLFGGRNGLWRMTGNAEYNYDPDRISNLGPIDAYATTRTEDVFGYISTAGMHITDGISTQDISEPLQAHFENQEPISGAVLFLPNSHSLWSIVFARLDGSTHRQTFLQARQWQQWADLEIEQATRFEQVNVTGDTETIVLIAEKTPYTRQILWENLTSAVDTRTTEQDAFTPINWTWKSQKIDFAREGIATMRKKFTQLIIEGKGDVDDEDEPRPLDVTFMIYDTNNDITAKTVQRTLKREHLYKTRVPIQKLGQAIEFIVTGSGNIDIRSFCLKGSI